MSVGGKRTSCRVLSVHVLLTLVLWLSPFVRVTTAAFAFQLESQIQELAQHARTSSRELLQPRHQRDFPGSTLFDEFSRTICRANAVPRKELYEAWATALYVHDRFPNSRRVADLACGHGLLSWALLILNEQRSAICIDKRMPASADKVAHAMIHHWPQLASRWDYVSSTLDAIEPCSSTLLCGIHACGTLSDRIISLAIQANAPLVFIPCCHTKQSLDRTERNQFIQNNQTVVLSEFVDSRRIERLQRVGYIVDRKEIPQAFTPMNTVILGVPPTTPVAQGGHATGDVSTIMAQRPKTLPPSLLSIPIGDNAISIAKVKTLSGRVAAESRKKLPPPALSVALFLPPSDDDADNKTTEKLTPDLLTNLLCVDPEQISIDYADATAYLHPNGRYARTYRIVYAKLTKEQANKVHGALCQQIPNVVPGAIVRSTGCKTTMGEMTE
jgi:Methyltransferase domain